MGMGQQKMGHDSDGKQWPKLMNVTDRDKMQQETTWTKNETQTMNNGTQQEQQTTADNNKQQGRATTMNNKNPAQGLGMRMNNGMRQEWEMAA